MPPLPSPGAVIKVEFGFAVMGDVNVLTRLFFKYTGGPPTVADLTTIADDIGTDYGTDVKTYALPQVVLNTVTVTDLATSSGNVGLASPAVAGTNAGGLVSPGTATLFNYTVSRRYRGGKPRSYWPLGAESDIATTGLWGSTYLSNVQTAVNTLRLAIEGISTPSCDVGAQVNVSYYEGFTAVENPITGRWKNVSKLRDVPVVDLITLSTANAKIGSQRRRNRAA